ncbi:MAG: glycoside hydrolase family 43 protein [bacterium]
MNAQDKSVWHGKKCAVSLTYDDALNERQVMPQAFLSADKVFNVTNFLRGQRRKNGGQKNVYSFSALRGEYDTKRHFSVFHLFVFACAFAFCILGCTSAALGQNSERFTNPILAGFYPDPSICRAGNDYYLVTSSFSYFPGIPIFHSKDLANWKQIGHVMDRPEQLDLDGLGVSRGIFAPAIRHHAGVFYVTCTLVDKGGNFVVTSKKPEGPWSNPVWIPQINGIDPSLFFDENGKAYVVYNSIAPDDKPLYNGHRTLRMYEFDVTHLKVTGDEILLVNGGVDLSKKPIWIEAPHIFQKDGYYYLIAAEGGTADQHSEVVFRSTKVDGPYVPYERNPILTQRHLDPKRKNAITSTGHADFVETESGDWWAVFFGMQTLSAV